MPNKQTKCSVCGQTIRTLSGAIMMREAPVVCRRCFGHQTYSAPVAPPINLLNLPDQPGSGS
jgi:DNA-directed RNA polymerase subunit RPC12/RpoP